MSTTAAAATTTETYILHETFAWSKINKDNIIISILIIMYFILYFMKLSHNKNKIDYEIDK